MKNILFRKRLNASKALVAFIEGTRYSDGIIKGILSLEDSALARTRPFSELLIEVLYQRQNYKEAVNVYRRQKPGNQLFPASLVRSLVKAEETSLVDIELEKYLDKTSLGRTMFFHVYETAMSSVAYPHEKRTRLRNERVIKIEVAPSENKAWQDALLNNGFLWKLEELEADGILEQSVAQKMAALEQFLSELLPYARLAGLNNCRELPEKTVVTGNQHRAYMDMTDERIIELNIPATFFHRQSDTATRSVRGHLIDFYTNVIGYFREQEIPFMPILQFGWNATPLDQGNIVLSHHTRGGSGRHFHIKSSAIKGFVSIDEAGFAGWSSVAEEQPQCRQKIEQVDIGTAETTWRNMFDSIVGNNRSKYAQPDRQDEEYSFEYIFLPMQIAGDLVASLSFIPGHELASFLAEKLRGSKYKLVIKRHPLCRNDETRELLEKLGREDHVVLSNASVHDLIKNASLIATVNSGVGMEAILHLKNVVITGKADYLYGATLARNTEELGTYLDSDYWKQPHHEALKKFIHFYFSDFLVDASSKEAVAARLRAILPTREAG